VPTAAKAHERENLAAPQSKRNGPVFADRRILDLEHRLLVARVENGEERVDRTPSDRLDQSGEGDGADRARQRHHAVTEHGHPVRDPEHLVEAMGHVQHRHALLAQPVESVQERVDLVRGECRGRLVEDDDLGRGRHRPRDCDHRPLAGCEGADLLRRIDVAADRAQRVACLHLERPPGDQPTAAGVAHDEAEVLGHRHALDQAEVLVDEVERKLRVPGVDALSPVDHSAAVGVLDAGQHPDEGGLSGAVLPGESVNLSGQNRHRDLVERLRSGVSLGQRYDPEQRIRIGRQLVLPVFHNSRKCCRYPLPGVNVPSLPPNLLMFVLSTT
jgi:hypothetical protein